MAQVRGQGTFDIKTGRGGPTFDFRTIPPLKEFQFKLTRFTAGISDFTPMFERIGHAFVKQQKKHFQSEGGPQRWAPLSDEYAAWKARKFPGRKIGVLTGALRASQTGGAGYSQDIGKTKASFGMADSSKAAPYAKYFAGGTKHMPARPVIVATAFRGERFRKTAVAWVREEAHHNGLIGWGSGTFRQELPSMSYQEPLSVDLRGT